MSRYDSDDLTRFGLHDDGFQKVKEEWAEASTANERKTDFPSRNYDPNLEKWIQEPYSSQKQYKGKIISALTGLLIAGGLIAYTFSSCREEIKEEKIPKSISSILYYKNSSEYLIK